MGWNQRIAGYFLDVAIWFFTLSTVVGRRSRKLLIADFSKGETTMPPRIDHVKVLDKKITELSDALAHLGQGTDLKELLRIIRFPGWTTPAEFAFAITIIDSMQIHANALSNLGTQLLAGGKLVGTKEQIG
jgi:hypothetical protein